MSTKYRIYCITEGDWQTEYADTPCYENHKRKYFRSFILFLIIKKWQALTDGEFFAQQRHHINVELLY